jgi:hypothetical protein
MFLVPPQQQTPKQKQNPHHPTHHPRARPPRPALLPAPQSRPLPRGSALSQNRLCGGTQRPGSDAKAQQGQRQSVSGSRTLEVPGHIPDAAGFCPGQAHTPAVNLVVLQEDLLVSLLAQIACRIGKLAAWGIVGRGRVRVDERPT